MPPTKRAAIVKDKSIPSSEGFDYPSEDEINEPPASFNNYIKCFFGKKGSGKTTLTASFPSSLTLMVEPRRRGLRIRQKNLQKATAEQIMDGAPDIWSQLQHTTQQFIDDESIDCLNFDSIDIWYEACYHSVCASNSLKSPSEAGKSGSDVWNQIRDEWACYFDTLAASRLSINLLSHEKTREQEDLEKGKSDIVAPSCTPACLQYIKQAVDFVFHYGFHSSGKRAVRIRDPYGIAWVAVGPENVFMQPDGKPINMLEMPTFPSAKTGYQVLCEAFANQHWDIDTPEDQRTISKVSLPQKKGPPKK